MTHYGLICPASTGHWNTILPLGKELQQRGHRVTLVGIPDAQPKAQAAGLEFQVIGEAEYPSGSAAKSIAELGELSGQEAFKYTIKLFAKITTISLKYSPAAIKNAGIEALLIDQAMPEGGTIANTAGLPFITICSAVVLNREPGVPPFVTTWNYSSAWWAKLRNRLGYQLLNRATQPITNLIDKYRQEHNLPAYSHANDRYSPLAQISQQPAELEFPRKNLPEWFHFTGPYHNSTGREVADFPFDKLTGQPLIYVSMGTIQNRLLNVFQAIAEACQNLDAQLVISLGGSADPQVLQGLAGNPLVVRYAPQLQLLEKADLTITHAGMNTTLECLTNGVPMVAIPIANDQPGIASRIVWSGCGEAIPVKDVNVDNLRKAITKVFTEPAYKNNALRLQAAIKKAGGTKRAVDIIEQAISTGKPVLK
ncbi:MAG: glycosyltransferase [Cuspidothrix sp.]